MSFESFNLHPSVMAGVRALGYVTPTPIQLKAIPPILQGRDIIGLAQTGTGKTAAFALPILNKLLDGPRGRVRALVISPTRELAEQTCEAFSQLGYQTGLRAAAVYGGVGMEPQVRALSAGAEIVAACPGRLIDHLYRGTFCPSYLEVLVIDEADRMFDMGFLPDIRNILRCILNPRQTMLFSATMPDDIGRLVREVLHEPVTVQIGITAPAKTVSHVLYPVKPHLKTELLTAILRRTDTESVLIFTRTKHRAERLERALRGSGFKATSLQGNLCQSRRQEALDAFRNGYVKILVATDLAARGLDVLSISHVINYDMPDTTDAYIHRIGRTGRIEQSGEAFTLVSGEDEPMVRALERILKAPIERRTLPDFDYAASAPRVESGRAERPSRAGRAPRRRMARAAN
ncbi:MAG: DEAD/DEAH box helicase [Chloroflexi bacterium]|nr:DEAD/DEAH box helicase [Chloroflexota bacterium]